ncbi:MAG: DUF6516 family protein [Methylophilaceae bacterium]
MKAELLERYRYVFDDGMFVEVVLWRVPEPVKGSQHPYKYRLFYGTQGKRIVGYDNERPKGNHRHYDDQEQAYKFSTPEQLIADFLSDVQQRRAS